MRGIYLLLFLVAMAWSTQSRAQFTVDPPVIDFGAVRADTTVDSFFVISAFGPEVTLDSLNYQAFIKDKSVFQADSIKGFAGFYKLTNNIVRINVRFSPHANRTYQELIRIHNNQGDPLTVMLRGRGIAPEIASSNIAFGKLRVGDARRDSIRIRNISALTTTIDSVSVVRSALFDTADFHLLDTLVRPKAPEAIAPDGELVVRIVERFDTLVDSNGVHIPEVVRDTIRSKHDTVRHIRVLFSPRSIGQKSLVIQIHTTTGQIVYDTFTGFGAEPFVTVTPGSSNFGNIDVSASTPPYLASSFTISNTGTWPAHIGTLSHRDTNFALSASSAQTLDSGQRIVVYDTFKITQEGDFLDTIRFVNDTRFSLYANAIAIDSIAVLSASVRLPALHVAAQSFPDTIRNCDLHEGRLVVHNPYPITIRIDSLYFDSTATGLKLLDSLLEFPVRVAPDSSFTFQFGYLFPNDSLNGIQEMTVHLVNRHADGDSVGAATMLAIRQRPELSLVANPPSFVSSANDLAMLDLPIKVKGPRQGVRELDAWTMTLTFSNDLFLPVDLDTTGGLVTQHGTTPFSLSYDWDQPSRTFTITTSGAKLSDTLSRFNDLLFRVRMRAFLTPDTDVTVTPVMKFVEYPCAYTLHPFTLRIPYANDCGDIILRTFMRSDSIAMRISALAPNPAPPLSPVALHITAASEMTTRITTFDAAGRRLGSFTAMLTRGANEVMIAPSLLPRSGLAQVLVEGMTNDGSLTTRQAIKLAIQN